MVDFRPLGYFLVACENENLGAAARELGIAPSTLSASLKALEATFGVSLFRKRGSGLSPRPLAHWLYRAAVPLLLLEEFARRRIAAAQAAPVSRLRVDVELRFAFGRLRRALAQATANTAAAEPLVLVDPHWPLEPGASMGVVTPESLGFAEQASVTLAAVGRAPDPLQGEIALGDDPWVLVRRRLGPENDLREDGSAPRSPLLPELPADLADQALRHCRAHGIEVRTLAAPPGDWPQLLEDHPCDSLLLPRSMIGVRLGAARSVATPLDPPLASALIAHTDGSALARRFVERFRAALESGDAAPVLAPVLTERRLRFFNLAYDLGRVSAAARAASVAQPALSQQLHKLEQSLGASLFDRHTFGLARNDRTTDFALAARLLDRRLRELEMSGMAASLAEGGRLSLGVLPSVSHHGHLVSRITEAVLALRTRYPAMSVTVREAPNGTLQSWVRRGRVGLAIVETAPSQIPRLALDASEELALIADPRHALLPPGPVRLRDAARLPLALPTSKSGIRRLLDAAARESGVELKPRHEIDALAMLIAMLTREPIATVLPASALRREIGGRELSAHPIIDPEISRRLFVIYSGDRSLTAAERDLVKLLRTHLSQGEQHEAAGSATVTVAG